MSYDNGTALVPELYLLYKYAGLSWPLILCSVSLCLVGFTGVLLNLAVIFVTIRNRNLHGSANYLLALASFFEVLHQPMHLLFLCVTLSGQNFIDLGLAIPLVLPSQFGIVCVMPAMLAIGFDRLLCVLFPFRTQKMSKCLVRLYLAALTLFCCLFGVGIVLDLLKLAEKLPYLKVTGCIEDIILSNMDSNNMPLSLGLMLVTILIYITVGVLIKCKHSNDQQSSNQNLRNRLIYRTLLCIVLVNIGGYLVPGVFTFCLMQFHLSAMTMWFVSQALTVVVNISAASNGPILWATSAEYCKAFQREIDLFSKKFLWKNTTPVQKITIQQNT